MSLNDFQKLHDSVREGDAELTERLVGQMKENLPTVEILENLLIGMDKVREKFEKGEIFPVHVIRSLSAFAAGTKTLELAPPRLKDLSVKVGPYSGNVYEVTKQILFAVWKSSGFSEEDPLKKDKWSRWGTLKENEETLEVIITYCPTRPLKIRIW
ncbi:B12-binding domain-containing protein [Candidatus Hecatella orcuttiae]|uniref:B12-binding domain-containing protein n=1 Tax=Candidatus Hecatella orcuttiae TaxID=1935119 RepID=UPI002867E561|nr:B12-binding domain-containing protein [Candidatus Hecatella orcuttiae]